MKRLLTITLVLITQLSFSQNAVIIEQSECDPYNHDPFELRERIVSKFIENDTLKVVLGKREICCATFKANYKKENDTIKINYKNIGDYCFCTCFYELTFKIPYLNKNSIHITFNGLEFKQSDKKKSDYETKVDNLENGNILRSKYENEELIFELEDQDSIKIYRQYYKGILQSENKLKKNNTNNNK